MTAVPEVATVPGHAKSAAVRVVAATVDTRYHSLDLWRGVACLMVVIFHATFYGSDNPDMPRPKDGFGGLVYFFVHRAWLGVPLFFVISGYCITAASMATRGSVGTYFIRRFRRIYPPAWICIALVVALFWALAFARLEWLLTDPVHPIRPPAALTPWQWFGNLALIESWRGEITGNGQFFMGHYWSLCYEEQFYAICGLILLFGRSHRVFFACAAAITVGVLLAYSARLHSMVPSLYGWFFDGRWLMFAAGIGVYWRIHHAARVGKVGIDAFFVGLALFGLWASRQTEAPTFMIGVELRTAAAFALVLGWLWRFDQTLARAPLARPLMWCGTICYSLYLTHWPVSKVVSTGLYHAGVRGHWVTLFVTLPVCVVASLGVAWLFHIWVERRFLNTGRSVPLNTSGVARA